MFQPAVGWKKLSRAKCVSISKRVDEKQQIRPAFDQTKITVFRACSLNQNAKKSKHVLFDRKGKLVTDPFVNGM